MKTRRFVLAFALALIVGCGSSSGPRINAISIEDEWQHGAQMGGDLSTQLQLVNDADSLAYVRDIGQRMVVHTNMATLPWEFHIVRDDQVNAFSIPGGHI